VWCTYVSFRMYWCKQVSFGHICRSSGQVDCGCGRADCGSGGGKSLFVYISIYTSFRANLWHPTVIGRRCGPVDAGCGSYRSFFVHTSMCRCYWGILVVPHCDRR